MHSLKLGVFVVHGIAGDAGMVVDSGCILGAGQVCVCMVGVPVLHVCVRWTGHDVVGECMMLGCWVLWGDGDIFLNHTAIVV